MSLSTDARGAGRSTIPEGRKPKDCWLCFKTPSASMLALDIGRCAILIAFLGSTRACGLLQVQTYNCGHCQGFSPKGKTTQSMEPNASSSFAAKSSCLTRGWGSSWGLARMPEWLCLATATRNLCPTALLFSVGKMLNLSDGFVCNGYATKAYKCPSRRVVCLS